MKQFKDIVQEIGEWSQNNFGDQVLLAPFTGIVEEIGEIESSCSDELEIDAYCDTAIYFADLCYRAGIADDIDFSFESCVSPRGSIVVHLGELAHVVLKTHQKIRGFSDPHFAKLKLIEVAQNFWYSLTEDFASSLPHDFEAQVLAVWDSVSKRDWVKNPSDAAARVADAVAEVKVQEPFGD